MSAWQIAAVIVGLIFTHCCAAIYGVWVGARAVEKAVLEELNK